MFCCGDPHTLCCSNGICTQLSPRPVCPRHLSFRTAPDISPRSKSSARMWRCIHDGCPKRSSFNIEGSNMGAFCKQHSEDGMVNVRHRRCSYDSCSTEPSFNVKGSKTAAYCKEHADDGMVNVNSKRCSRDSCTRRPSFNIKGGQTAAYCKKHARDDMVNVRNRRCSHDSCTKQPSWGVSTDGVATICSSHKGDISGGPVINFKAMCKIAACRKVSRWGVNGRQPTYCRDHGPLEDGLVCTVGMAPSNISTNSRRPSYGAAKGRSFHIKTECFF